MDRFGSCWWTPSSFRTSFFLDPNEPGWPVDRREPRYELKWWRAPSVWEASSVLRVRM